MKGASVKKVILRFFSGNNPICNSQQYQPWQTPPSHFLTISPRFLTNIRCRYFSLNIWVVYDHLEFEWCTFDQNWAKTRPLHWPLVSTVNDKKDQQRTFLLVFHRINLLSLITGWKKTYFSLGLPSYSQVIVHPSTLGIL